MAYLEEVEVECGAGWAGDGKLLKIFIELLFLDKVFFF